MRRHSVCSHSSIKHPTWMLSTQGSTVLPCTSATWHQDRDTGNWMKKTRHCSPSSKTPSQKWLTRQPTTAGNDRSTITNSKWTQALKKLSALKKCYIISNVYKKYIFVYKGTIFLNSCSRQKAAKSLLKITKQ